MLKKNSFIENILSFGTTGQRLLQLFRKPLHVYTDGSYKKGRGAWAFVVARGENILCERAGTMRNTTSNRMEFQAAIEALKEVPPGRAAIFHTDSRVLLEALQKIPQWQAQGWRKKSQALIPSVDQMKELQFLTSGRRIEWKWVKAHAGVILNEHCDDLCTRAREKRDR